MPGLQPSAFILQPSSLVLLVLLSGWPADAVQIRDVVTVKGERSQQLIGYGLVVGLKGTGDKSRLTLMALQRFFERAGMTVDAQNLNLRNVALVLVTAELPPFAEEGMRVDVNVSAVGDATSLKGGRLVATPLHGPDPATVYARAQGSITFHGASEPAHTTSGIVRGGGIVERPFVNALVEGGHIQLLLKKRSSALAAEIADTINLGLRLPAGKGMARAISPAQVEVQVPAEYAQEPVQLLSQILRYPVDVDLPARIVVNEDAGAVSINDTVRVAPAAVAVGDIFLVIGAPVTQPETGARLAALSEGADLQSLVAALQRIRVTPRDLISVIEQLVAVGALHAELVVE